MLSPAKPHSHLVKPLAIFLWTWHWEDWWDKPIGNQVSSYSCRDNGGGGLRIGQSSLRATQSSVCVYINIPLLREEKEKKRQREGKDR